MDGAQGPPGVFLMRYVIEMLAQLIGNLAGILSPDVIAQLREMRHWLEEAVSKVIEYAKDMDPDYGPDASGGAGGGASHGERANALQT